MITKVKFHVSTMYNVIIHCTNGTTLNKFSAYLSFVFFSQTESVLLICYRLGTIGILAGKGSQNKTFFYPTEPGYIKISSMMKNYGLQIRM